MMVIINSQIVTSRSRKTGIPQPSSSASSSIAEEHTHSNQSPTLGVIVGEVTLGDDLLELLFGKEGGGKEGGGGEGRGGEGRGGG